MKFLLTLIGIFLSFQTFAVAQVKPQSFEVAPLACSGKNKEDKPLYITQFVWQHTTKPLAMLVTHKDNRIIIHKCTQRRGIQKTECMSYYQGEVNNLCKQENRMRKVARGANIVGNVGLGATNPISFFGGGANVATSALSEIVNLKKFFEKEGCINLESLFLIMHSSENYRERLKAALKQSDTPSMTNLIPFVSVVDLINERFPQFRSTPSMDTNSKALMISLNNYYQAGKGPDSGANKGQSLYDIITNEKEQVVIEPAPSKKEVICKRLTSEDPSWAVKTIDDYTPTRKSDPALQ